MWYWIRVAIVVPFVLPGTLFNAFWYWWHFGPSQRILRVGRCGSFTDRMAKRFVGKSPVTGKRYQESIDRKIDELHK